MTEANITDTSSQLLLRGEPTTSYSTMSQQTASLNGGLVAPPNPSSLSKDSTKIDPKADTRSSTPSNKDEHDTEHHRFLTDAEWRLFARGVGGIRDLEKDMPTHPSSSSWWAPRGMPSGLYRDVVTQRTNYYNIFYLTSAIQWTLMILQLLLGASLTALGSVSVKDGTPITVLGAANTIIAGLLALVHNSGLPDRYKHNMYEFEQVQDHIKEILDSRLIPADETLDQVMAECFDMYQEAKDTVISNMPINYNSRGGGKKGGLQRALTARTLMALTGRRR